jgi:hypothetical protein
VGAGFYRIEDISFGTDPRAGGPQDVAYGKLNYLSGVYPFKLLDHNMVASINYQHLYDFTRRWNYSIGVGQGEVVHEAYQHHGNLYAYGLAYCVEIVPAFSLGFTLNLWEDGIYQNGWGLDEVRRYVDKHQVIENRVKESFSFSGINANLGFLWSVTDSLTLGGVFKTPFTADLEHHLEHVSSSHSRQSPGIGTTNRWSSSTSEEMTMPMSYGLGVAYRFSDEFTSSADVYLTHWQDFVLEDSKGNKTSPVTGRPVGESDIGPTVQVRLGSEYLFIMPKYIIPVRGGVFYDPAPAQGGSDPYFGFSVGSGIGVGRFILDFAYQYRFGLDVGKSILRTYRYSEDVYEHAFYTSLIVHF